MLVRFGLVFERDRGWLTSILWFGLHISFYCALKRVSRDVESIVVRAHSSPTRAYLFDAMVVGVVVVVCYAIAIARGSLLARDDVASAHYSRVGRKTSTVAL